MFNRRECLTAVSTSLVMSAASTGAEAMPAPVSPRSMIRLLTPSHTPMPCQLADIKWMEGSWIGQMLFGPVEQVMLPTAAAHMPGFVRAMNSDSVVFYEICLFAQAGASIAHRVKHFSSNLSGWEAQDAYIDRLLVDRESDTFFFNGITLAHTGRDSHTVYFLNRDGENELDTLVIHFRRKS